MIEDVPRGDCHILHTIIGFTDVNMERKLNFHISPVSQITFLTFEKLQLQDNVLAIRHQAIQQWRATLDMLFMHAISQGGT